MTPQRPETRGNRNSAPAPRARAADDRAGAPKALGQPNMPPRKAWLTFAIILLLNYVLMSFLFPTQDTSVTIPYTDLQGGGGKGQRQVDLQHGREHRGPLREAGDVAAAERREDRAGECRRGRRTAGTAGEVPAQTRSANGGDIHDHAAGVRRPGSRVVPDQARRRDQRRSDQVRQRTAGHAALRLRPGDPHHRVLRLDVSPRTTGRPWAAR